MYPSLNKNSSTPQMCSSLSSNYYNDNIHFKNPEEHYHTPSSSSSFLVPSPIYFPLEDEAVFCEFFQQEQFFSNDSYNHNILAHEMTTNVESAIGEYSNNNEQAATNHGDDDHGDVEPDNNSPRKRRSNRDRHRKINTARGPRDRRIRLSLDVAKRLFRLQDLLRFDKASKTVDWLLTESKSAILDLLPDHSCSFMVKIGVDQATKKTKAKSSSESSKKQKHKIAKETRVRARQRARERTLFKQINNKHSVGVNDQDSVFGGGLDQQMDHDLNQPGSWSIFKKNQHLIMMDQMSSNFQFHKGFVGDNSSCFTKDLVWSGHENTVDYQHSSELTDEHQLNDLHIKEKTWEDQILHPIHT
ncbi:hypothetical protein R6Q59_025301 [Mikania micrantha]